MMALATAVARPSARRSKGAGRRFIRVAIECCGEWSMSSLEHVVGSSGIKIRPADANRAGGRDRRLASPWTPLSAQARPWDTPGA